MRVASDVEKALSRLPQNLAQVYSHIWEQIHQIAPDGQAVAKKALRWLLCAKRSLSVDEFVDVIKPPLMTLEPGDILNLCCNFVVIDTELDTFRFAHASIREFIEDQEGFNISSNINILVAEECMGIFLSQSSIPRPSQLYASHYWIIHYGDLKMAQRRDTKLQRIVKRVFNEGNRPSAAYMAWRRFIFTDALVADVYDFRLLSHLHRVTDDESPLVTACAFGLLEIVEELAIYRPLLSATGLYLATTFRYYDVVDCLLRAGADKDAEVSFRERPIHRACENGDERISRLLLEAGADTTAADEMGWTPLDWAAKGTHQAVFRLLVRSSVQQEAMIKYGEPLLQWACGIDTDAQIFRGLVNRPTGYIGVKNEGQTGYLNAVLQFLYMLKPFHQMLDRFVSTTDDDGTTFLFALHRLFLEMATSKEVVSTNELTRAFGWSAHQLQQPSDPIEMLINMLFDMGEHLTQLPDLHNSRIEATTRYYNDDQVFRRSEDFHILSIDTDGIPSLHAGLSDFFVASDKERTSSLIVQRFSPVLVLSLKRFRYDLLAGTLEKVRSSTLSYHVSSPTGTNDLLF
ncbi:MAG: hypothetical protein Q9167_007700 [Letrouitia subvulpina]